MTQQEDAQQPLRPSTMDEKEDTAGDVVDVKPKVNKYQDATNSRTSQASPEDDLATKVFHFLSIATPTTLGWIAVVLAAVTYLVLGQVGLLLIGAFGGVVAFVQWEQQNIEVARAVKGEKGVEILSRLLESIGRDRKTSERDADEEERALAHGFDHFQSETRDALNELVDAIVRDYIRWWYTPIMPGDKFFPLACRKTLTSFLVSVSNHLAKKRPADAFLDFLTNASSMVVVFLSELSNVLAESAADNKMSTADALRQYLDNNAESNLAHLLSQRQQAAKFRMVAEDLLGFLDRHTYECDPARIFLREILAGAVLETSLQTCSRPEWINSWIVHMLEAGEPDLSQAIDVGMQTGPGTDAVFSDMDGNVGNVGLTKGNLTCLELERRRKEVEQKKRVSKADEEMGVAMEEMKRLNQMIAEEKAKREKSEANGTPEPSDREPRERQSEGKETVMTSSERLTKALQGKPGTLTNLAPRSQPTTGSDSPSLAGHFKEHMSGSGSPSLENSIKTPPIPRSDSGLSPGMSPPPRPTSRFTSFDQIMAPGRDDSEDDLQSRKSASQLSLHNATITVLDEAGDKGRVRTKPSWDYLIQIEPVSSLYPGWMIVRRYSDFERLHEILGRIAKISGATAFSEQHKILPSWKVHTRTSLRGELERYVRDACWFQSLADSEGMKRFLEKDKSTQGTNPSRSGLQAFEKFGKNVFDVLANAPMEGSKAVVGGVAGVLGNMGLGQKKNAMPLIPSTMTAATTAPASPVLQDVTAASRLSITTPTRLESLVTNGTRKRRDSLDSQLSSLVSTQPGKVAPMERSLSSRSHTSQGEADEVSHPPRSEQWSERSTRSTRNSRANSRASSLAPLASPSAISLDGVKLPPPPDAMPDDYESYIGPESTSRPRDRTWPPRSLTAPIVSRTRTPGSATRTQDQYPRLSEHETRVAVELLFAVINELYTLSSAWNIRRTLLAAAKSFLLRPGNPSLVSIQTLIQTAVIEANTSDAGLATHLRKLRENAIPTPDERAARPPDPSADDKEKLRARARKLLIASGVPAALMGVMGQSATSDALGRLFDCLQIEEVARGLMFGILLQAARIVTH